MLITLKKISNWRHKNHRAIKNKTGKHLEMIHKDFGLGFSGGDKNNQQPPCPCETTFWSWSYPPVQSADISLKFF